MNTNTLPKTDTIEQTIQKYKNIIDTTPNVAQAHDDLISLLIKNKLYDQAQTYCNDALKLFPKNTNILNHEANIKIAENNFQQAEIIFKKILEIDPTHIKSFNNLSTIYFRQGNIQQGLNMLQIGIKENPYSYQLNLALGKILVSAKQYKEAEIYLINTLKYTDTPAEAQYFLGKAAFHQKKSEEALTILTSVYKKLPNNPDIHYMLAFILFDAKKNIDTSAKFAYNAIKLDPQNTKYQILLGKILTESEFKVFVPEIKLAFIELLKSNNVEKKGLGFAWYTTFINDPSFETITSLLNIQEYHDFEEKFKTIKNVDILEHEFLLLALKELIVPYLNFERLFTFIRRFILNCTVSKEKHPILEKNALISSMVSQCFLNEYIWYTTSNELEAALKLSQSLTNQNSEQEWLITACYMPLRNIKNNNIIPQNYIHLIEQKKHHIDDYTEEQQIKESIETLGTIEDNVSLKVQEQYEVNPYPRWKTINTLPVQITLENKIKLLFPHLNTSNENTDEHKNILIAGCGTGRHGINESFTYDNASILAIDLCKSSLAYAIRKSREYNTQNIEFKQADILKLGSLNKKFDLIESCGVLHHMEDPIKGWKTLVSILKPNGYMKIALYSTLSREHVTATRHLIKEQSYGTDINKISEHRHNLITEHRNEKLDILSSSEDFYTSSTFRDLLFHVQEHCFTLLEIEEITKELGLEFLGFGSSHGDLQSIYKKQFPDDPTANSFKNWHELEKSIPYSFASMYQMWFRKTNSS